MAISLNNINSEVLRAHKRIDDIRYKTITNAANANWSAIGTYKLTTPLNSDYRFIYLMVSQPDGSLTDLIRIPFEYRRRSWMSASHDEYTNYTFSDDASIKILDFSQNGVRQGVIKMIYQANLYYKLAHRLLTSINFNFSIIIKRGEIL